MAWSKLLFLCVLSVAVSACANDGETDDGREVEFGDGDSDGGSDGDSDGDGDSDSDGGNNGDGGETGTGGALDGPAPLPPPAGYPEGPYGSGNPQVGDVLENLHFEGFLRLGDDTLVSDGEISEVSLDDLRTSGSTHAFIHTATVWCPSCRSAADDLAPRGDELSNLGVSVLELVTEGDYGTPPTDAELSLWAAGSNLTVSTVRPADDRGPVVFPSREFVYIVDLSDMSVVWRMQALFSDPTVTEQGIEEMLRLLD